VVILAWIALGLTLGIFARHIMAGESPGVAADAIAGSLGAAAGGCLDLLFRGRAAQLTLASMVSAAIGAVVLLWLVRTVRSKLRAG